MTTSCSDPGDEAKVAGSIPVGIEKKNLPLEKFFYMCRSTSGILYSPEIISLIFVCFESLSRLARREGSVAMKGSCRSILHNGRVLLRSLEDVSAGKGPWTSLCSYFSGGSSRGIQSLCSTSIVNIKSVAGVETRLACFPSIAHPGMTSTSASSASASASSQMMMVNMHVRKYA